MKSRVKLWGIVVVRSVKHVYLTYPCFLPSDMYNDFQMCVFLSWWCDVRWYVTGCCWFETSVRGCINTFAFLPLHPECTLTSLVLSVETYLIKKARRERRDKAIMDDKEKGVMDVAPDQLHPFPRQQTLHSHSGLRVSQWRLICHGKWDGKKNEGRMSEENE